MYALTVQEHKQIRNQDYPGCMVPSLEALQLSGRVGSDNTISSGHVAEWARHKKVREKQSKCKAVVDEEGELSIH